MGEVSPEDVVYRYQPVDTLEFCNKDFQFSLIRRQSMKCYGPINNHTVCACTCHRERESACTCHREREREMCMYMSQRERERDVLVHVTERERCACTERERECACTCHREREISNQFDFSYECM